MQRSVMKTIRIVLTEMRPRLRDILTDALAEELDMELIDWEPPSHDAFTAEGPDVIVYEREDPLDCTLPTRILQEAPRARVLAIGGSGSRAALFELRPTRTVMRALGMADVVAAIRFGIAGDSATLVCDRVDRGRP